MSLFKRLKERMDQYHNWQPSEEIKNGVFDLNRRLLGPNMIFVDQEKDINVGAITYDFGRGEFIFSIPFTFLGGERLNRLLGTGKTEIVLASKLYDDIYGVFGLHRLQSIRQFTYLTRSEGIIYPDKIVISSPYLEKTRFLHSLGTTVMMEIWMRYNGYNEKEILHGILMAYLHDLATSAFGDMLKYFHPKEFDEEANLRLFINSLDQNKIREFCQNYGIDLERVIRAIEDRKTDPLARILNWIDRINYVCNDLYAMVFEIQPLDNQIYPGCNLHPSLVTLADTNFDRSFGDCFLDLKINKKGEVYVKDVKQFETFLLVRALLSRDFYYSPVCRKTEIGLSQYFLENFYYTGNIKREELISMTEVEVVRLLTERIAPENPALIYLKNIIFPSFPEEIQRSMSFSVGKVHKAPKQKCIYTQQAKFNYGANLLVKKGRRFIKFADLGTPLVQKLEEIKQTIEQPVNYYKKTTS